ncbi:hypothetical protein SAMN05421858_5015 [Haladaptatus litoreus]|uniref:Uncharacterized protein n=1 Tax=Haladaptatus litoreus TaxID=553468 RepID=A0A1N7FEN1_9EURY|nr:hypothetical protein SAMN05421858_5015 [Haladaptatus litoreus]
MKKILAGYYFLLELLPSFLFWMKWLPWLVDYTNNGRLNP